MVHVGREGGRREGDGMEGGRERENGRETDGDRKTAKVNVYKLDINAARPHCYHSNYTEKDREREGEREAYD